MARAYAGSAGTHMFFGLLCMAAGIAWICLLYFFEPLFVTPSGGGKPTSILTDQPAWLAVLLSAKIYCGFWFFLTGAVGCCIKSRGCTEGVFVALNVLNVIIWAPVLLLLMAVLGLIIIAGSEVFASAGIEIGNDYDVFKDHFESLVWLWAFPAVGILVGVVEFILSIISYSIVCCCRPAQLNEGYEYQYEMK